MGGLTSDNSSKSWLIAPPANAQEIVEMRTQNSKTWLLEVLPDGRAKLAWEGSIGAVHYKKDPNDPNEPWKDIITDIIPLVSEQRIINNEQYDYKMDRAEYSVYFKDKFNEGKIVRYEKGGEWLEIKPGNLKWIEDGSLSAEQLISEPRDVTGSPTSRNQSIEFQNQNGETLWYFAPLRYWDSAESRNEGVADFVIKEVRPSEVRLPEEVGLQQILSIRVPYSWLKNALFPVYIDLDLRSGNYNVTTRSRTSASTPWVAIGTGIGWKDKPLACDASTRVDKRPIPFCGRPDYQTKSEFIPALSGVHL
ncbi:MAG: hypothetical protein ABIG08_03505 [bacterium]